MQLHGTLRSLVTLALAGGLWQSVTVAADAPAGPAPEAGPFEALDLAFKFASAIPVVPHATERGTWQYNAIKAIVDQGKVDEAARRVTDMVGYRQGQAYTDIAAAYAARGSAKDRELMLESLERAREARGGIEGFNAGWQKDRVTAAIAIVQIRAGMRDEAQKTLMAAEPSTVALVKAEELTHIDDDADYADTLKQLRAMGKSEDFEVLEAAVRAHTRLLENHGKGLAPERLDELAAEAVAVAAKLPFLLQCSLRTELARALLASGCRERGLQILTETHEGMTARGLNPRFDVAFLAAMATVYAEVAGDPEKADALLAEGAELLKGKGAEIELRDRVTATIALAAGYAARGAADAAWTHFRAALKGARDQGNGRPRHMMLTDLCVAIGRARYSLPADVRLALEHEWKRRGNPW